MPDRCCLLLALPLLACAGRSDDLEPQPLTVPALGSGAHSLDAVNLEVIGTADDGLTLPRDLEFNPEVPGELWVMNSVDDSVVIFFDAGTGAQRSEKINDPYALHFLDNVSSLSFGAPGTFGTCQESRNTYNDQGRPNNFMGPTLWSSDLEIFGQSNPEAVDYLTERFGMHTDLGSHLDMLHESPLCMGIAWDFDNVYWVFDGYNQSIARYDFFHDHGPGYDDHSDGIIMKYVTGGIQRLEDVPSHLVLDHETALLYVNDTGNNKLKVLDTLSGTRGQDLRVQERGTDHYEMVDAEMWNLVDGADHGWVAPSGLVLVDGVLLLTDNGTSTLWALTLEGEVIDHLTLDLEPGRLMGIEARTLDELWLTDAVGQRVLRLTPRG